MEIAQLKINVKANDIINIYFLGDIHEGNVNHNEKAFKEAVKIIKDDKNALWIGMGDYIEAITFDDKKRFNPVTISEKYSVKDLRDLPKRQAEAVFHILNPIQSKCIALLIGNHEEAYMKHNHSDIYNTFINMFASSAFGAIPPVKIGYVGFVRLLFCRDIGNARSKLDIALNHGVGGSGKSEGYAINKIHEAFMGHDADICVMGHIHQLAKDTQKITSVGNNLGLRKRRKFWGSSGCFLNTYVEGNANYFENRGRVESDIGMLKASVKFIHKISSDYLEISLNEIIID